MGHRPEHTVTLDEFAREAGLSPWYFHRLFTRAYGETPHRFLSRHRMDAARRLLIEGELSVAEICLAVGYQSVGTFTTVFSRENGRTPAEFRREARRFWAVGRLWSPRYVPHCFVSGWNRQD